ncbi:MAG: hypothetical protein LH615_11100, partial [Ferruginibacter sp.]|nr:hypothetical protein [Ferruginibacter sp.]
TIFSTQKESVLFAQYENSIRQRFLQMDKQVDVISMVATKKDALKIPVKDLSLWESGNEEEQLYTSIILSLKKTALDLNITQKSINRFNYAGFIF